MKRERQTTYVVVLVVSSSDAGSTPAISTVCALPLRRAFSYSTKRTSFLHMTIPIPFTKMSGAGNDFVVIDNMKAWLEADQPSLARAVCSRRFGIGADGLLILEASRRADFCMRYYNADGSYGGMCGNGGRCVARFAADHGIARREISFEALDHVYVAATSNASVKLQMKPASGLIFNKLSRHICHEFSVHYVDTGSPHAVVEVASLADLDVHRLGKELRNHQAFAPMGCNVNFFQRDPRSNLIELRTYERGVEAETLACGTGAVASAIIAATLHDISGPIDVKVRSGEHLNVTFTRQDNSFIDIVLTGSAYVIFEGTIQYDEQKNAIVGVPVHIENTAL